MLKECSSKEETQISLVAEEPVPQQESPPEQLGPEGYEVLSQLGSGGMGLVYKTKREGVDKTMAMKVLHPKLVADESSRKRFELEAKAASLLTHPNLVAVYDFGMSRSGKPYLVMDYVDGCSLGEILANEKQLPPLRFINIFMQVCDALSHAHGKQIIHRDLKPNNVMIMKDESGADFVKIVDFGIAKLLPTAQTDEQRVTQTGELLGSPVYMSPEQCLGDYLDARSDIYSLGCVMYEALTGKPPFLGDNVVQTILKHLNEAPEPFANACPELGIPNELEAIVFRCLEKSKAARFQTIDELKEALELLLDSTPQKRKQVLAHKVLRAKWRKRIGKLEKPIFAALCLAFAIPVTATHFASDATKYDALEILVNRAKLSDFSSWDSGAHYWARAIEEGEKIHASEKRMIDVYNRAGDAFDRSGRIVQARKVWQKALKLLERSDGAIADRLEIGSKLVNLDSIPSLSGATNGTIISGPAPDLLNADLLLLAFDPPKSLENMSTSATALAERFHSEGRYRFAVEEYLKAYCYGDRSAAAKALASNRASVSSDRKSQRLGATIIEYFLNPTETTLSAVEESVNSRHKDGSEFANHLKKAQEYLEATKYKPALVHYEQASRITTDNSLSQLIGALRQISEYHSFNGSVLELRTSPYNRESIPMQEKLLRLKEEAFGKNSSEADAALIVLARSYAGDKNYVAAERSYREVLERLPAEASSTQEYSEMARLMLLQNKNSQAVEWSKKAISNNRKSDQPSGFPTFEAYQIHFEALKRSGRGHEIAHLAKQLIVQNTAVPFTGFYTAGPFFARRKLFSEPD